MVSIRKINKNKLYWISQFNKLTIDGILGVIYKALKSVSEFYTCKEQIDDEMNELILATFLLSDIKQPLFNEKCVNG